MSKQEEHIVTLISQLPKTAQLRVIEAAVKLLANANEPEVQEWQLEKARSVLQGIRSGAVKTISQDALWDSLAEKTGFDPRKAS